MHSTANVQEASFLHDYVISFDSVVSLPPFVVLPTVSLYECFFICERDTYRWSLKPDFMCFCSLPILSQYPCFILRRKAGLVITLCILNSISLCCSQNIFSIYSISLLYFFNFLSIPYLFCTLHTRYLNVFVCLIMLLSINILACLENIPFISVTLILLVDILVSYRFSILFNSVVFSCK
jgi:hypothetical protein